MTAKKDSQILFLSCLFNIYSCLALLVSSLVSGIGYFIIGDTEEVIHAGIIEQSKLNKRISRHIVSTPHS